MSTHSATRRRLRPAFVVTLSAVAASCASDKKPEEPTVPTETRNPPEIVMPVASTEATAVASSAPTTSASTSASNPASASADRPLRLESFPEVVNPKDASGRTIFFQPAGACYVEMPFPPLKPGETREPGTAPPRRAVTCPAHMNDPAWSQCAGGTIRTDSQSCICFVMGNPPPPPWSTPCPAKRH